VLVVIAFQAYRLVRLASEGDRAIAVRHGTMVLRWEQRVGLAWERGVQDLVLRHDTVLDFCNTWYTWAFWPTVTGTMLVLYLWRPTLYRRYRNALFMSGAIGLAVFALFPVAPPRMLDGFVDTVHEFSSAGGFAHPTGFTNEYAAMPSFHVGWLVLAGVAVMPLVRRRALRPLLLLPAAVMFLVVMATANHYALDGLVGAGVVLLGLVGADRIAAPRPTNA
jgi:PAP2 superfamily